ncbi:MAG TPA: NAD-dependent epimerase/dehydratase family protein [Bryobacteraceae bacterium]|nr:NAD-dependent epimerase/dehydratase family protein [Bryobacteraceae bacterium]
MKVLVTGAAGFCAAHLIQRLRCDASIEIAGLDVANTSAAALRLDGYFQADITEPAAVARIVKLLVPDCIFHLAGAGASPLAASVCAVNVLGAGSVLEAVYRHASRCRVLVVGSAAEYGAVPLSDLPATEESACHPAGAYGTSKYAATLMALDYAKRAKLKIVVARPFNIVGPGIPQTLVVGALLARMKDALRSDHPVVRVGDFDSERDFVGVSDAVDAYVKLLAAEAWGEVFNICSGSAHTVAAVASMLAANSTRPIQVELDPNLVPPSAVRRIYGNFEKARCAIGFRPSRPLERVLADAWNNEIEAVICA